MVDADFVSRLVPAKDAALEYGDTVYFQHRFGNRPEDVAYRKRRVVEVNRGGVKVVDPGAPGRPVIIAKGQLFVERAEVEVTHRRPPSASTLGNPPQPRAAAPRVDDDNQYSAFLDMGRGLVEEIKGRLRGLAEQRANAMRDLDALDDTHGKRVAALESQLAAARQQHADDRALALTKLEALDSHTAHETARRRALESLLSAGDEPQQ